MLLFRPAHPHPLSLSLSKAARRAGLARVLRQAQHERALEWEENSNA